MKLDSFQLWPTDSVVAVRVSVESRAHVLRQVLLFTVLSGTVCCSSTLLCAQSRLAVPAKLPAAEKIVDGYLKAIGGKKRVAGLRDATYEWEILLKERTMGIARTEIKSPASVRTELSFGNGKIVSAANPRSAWTQGLDGKLHTLTGPEAAAARLRALLDASRLIDLKKGNVLSRVERLKSLDNGSAYAVEFSLRSGARLRYLFSPDTKLLVGIEDDARKTTTRLGDYRAEGAILEPHRMTIDIGGTGELTFALKRATYNTGLAHATFDPPRAAESLDVIALLREVSCNQEQLSSALPSTRFCSRKLSGRLVARAK